MPGIDAKRFVCLSEGLAKHLECSVCLNIFDNAVDTQCKHTFCLQCLQSCIESNSKTCPECRQPLTTRKRSITDSDNNVVIGGNVVVGKNRKINAIISELKIRCDNESNGCKQEIEFGLLCGHLKTCQYSLCPKCGFVGTEGQHNCIELLKNAMNKYKQRSEELEEKCKILTKNQVMSGKGGINDNQLEMSSESGNSFITKAVNRFSSSVNSLMKSLNQNSNEESLSCEPNRTESSIGSRGMNVSYDAINDINENSNNLRQTQNQNEMTSTQPSSAIITQIQPFLQLVPISQHQFITPNTSPNPTVLVHNNAMDSNQSMNESLKTPPKLVNESMDFPITAYPNYIMFGTYNTDAKAVELTQDGLKLTNVAPNSIETKFKYHIRIPFIEIQELMYCSDSTLPIIFVKPTKESNDKIQECMYLGVQSANGLRLNIQSNDSREHYIIVVLKDKINESFTQSLRQNSRLHNKYCKCEAITVDRGRLLLTRSQNRSILTSTPERRFHPVMDCSVCKTPPNLSEVNNTSSPLRRSLRLLK